MLTVTSYDWFHRDGTPNLLPDGEIDINPKQVVTAITNPKYPEYRALNFTGGQMVVVHVNEYKKIAALTEC